MPASTSNKLNEVDFGRTESRLYGYTGFLKVGIIPPTKHMMCDNSILRLQWAISITGSMLAVANTLSDGPWRYVFRNLHISIAFLAKHSFSTILMAVKFGAILS